MSRRKKKWNYLLNEEMPSETKGTNFYFLDYNLL